MEHYEISQNDERSQLEAKIAEYEEIIRKLEQLKAEHPDIASSPDDGGVVGSEKYNIWQDLATLSSYKHLLERSKKKLRDMG